MSDTPRIAVALIPVIITLAIFVGGIGILQYPAELMLVFAAIVFTIFAACHGIGLNRILTDMGEKIKRALPGILILLSIGILIGTWMMAGTIPLMINYGLELIDPSYLYLLSFLVTAIVATFTGTSWGGGGRHDRRRADRRGLHDGHLAGDHRRRRGVWRLLR